MAVAAYYAKLVYNANGGTGAPASQSAFSDEPSSSVYVTLSAGATRQYYRFNGWAPSSSASSGRTPGGKYYMTTSDTMYAANARVYTLYATWVHETATLSYNANGGSGAPSAQTVNKNEWFTLRTGVPTRSGYEFVGWNTSSTATAATYQPGGQARIVSNMTLYAVWKVSNSTISTISSSVPIDGSTQGSVSISSINNSYTHQLTLSIGESSQVISLAAGVTSATFTIPSSWLSEVPNSTTGTALASLKTFNGSTQVGGTDVKTFSITVPANIVPVITVATDYVNNNTTVDGWDILLQNFSQIKLTATASGGTGATVATFTFAGDGLSQTSASNEATSSVLTSSGSRSWTVTVTDSRGRTASTIVTDTVREYFSPSIASLTAFRSDSNGNRDDAAGTYLKATGVFSFASADGNNTLSVDAIEYMAEDGTSWMVGQSPAVSGNSYTFGGGLITETKLFHVRLSLTDALGNSAQYVVDVAPIVGYGFGLKNDRVHFGGPCKEPGFVCDFPTKLVNGHVVGSHSASGNYAKILTFSTDVQVGKNLLNDINPDVKNAYLTGAYKLGASANDRVVIIPINPNTDYTFTRNRVAIEGASSDDTNVLLFSEYPVIGTTVGTSTGVNTTSNPAVRTFNSGNNVYAAIKIANVTKTQYQETLSASQLELGTSSTSHEAYVNPSNINVNAPITLEYVKTGDISPTKLTITFNRDYTLASFVKDASADAYLVNSATAHWDLYIGKSSASDSIEILDFHNPWSNTDMTIDWEDSSVSTLPTGYISASKINGMMQCGVKTGSTVATHSYSDFTVTFPTPFPSIPTVCVSLYTSSTGYGMGSVSAVVCVGTVSTTGFTIRCYNNDSEGRNPAYTWIAIL